MAAAASSLRPMPLLRRPLPPKQLPTPPKSVSPVPPITCENQESGHRPQSPVTSYSGKVKPKPFSPLRGRKLYHGDVPLPDTSVVQPYKPRGPDGLPARAPRKIREYPPDVLIKDLYERPPPTFTLKNFLQRLPSRCDEDSFETMVSEQNYEKLTSWFAANRPRQGHLHNLEIERGVEMPDVTPRKPPRQVSIEMRVPDLGMETNLEAMKDQEVYNKKVNKTQPVTPATSKHTIPSRQIQRPLPPIQPKTMYDTSRDSAEQPGADNTHTPESAKTIQTVAQPTVTELIAPEGPRTQSQAKQDAELRSSLRKQQEIRKNADGSGRERIKTPQTAHSDAHYQAELMMKEKALTFEDWPEVIAYQETNIILPSSAPAFFQGEAIPRTASPFVSAEDYSDQVTPLEAVILNAIVTESAVLNVKAHFLNRLPSLSQLVDTLTHLNASFNDFWVFPPEILELKMLVSLKLRNNPIKAIPNGIGNLSQLKVFEMSFNLLTSLPASLFELKDLELLDLSYNRLSFIPADIGKLRALRELNLEGNQLGAMPISTLFLPLKYFRISNNFIHPLFWRETASNQPQRLLDLCALNVARHDQDIAAMIALPETLKKLLNMPDKCDCCGGAKFGEGLRVIKGLDEVFGVKNLPFLFSSCSQYCRKKFVKNKDGLALWLFRNGITITKNE
ncbi:uncharacterized protein LOC5511012 isoform X2 [Nematostella vectensis]|uniref:uncharacterized protein LOC5511012 isoform X2 n=1 Tax=Nematostella vectensis TaxID=45351 RepID=UPI00138FEF40|nr:uncharacterized protein LOC5511012 isoform X2 [Nematostella vectensis]